jgi:hypothetical protein
VGPPPTCTPWLAVGLSVGQPITALAIIKQLFIYFRFFEPQIHFSSEHAQRDETSSTSSMADHMSKFNEYRSIPVGEQGWLALPLFVLIIK